MDKDNVAQLDALMKYIDTNNKWISFVYNRTLTDPGFQRLPTPPSFEEVQAERMKKKQIEQQVSGEQPQQLEKVEETVEEEDKE